MIDWFDESFDGYKTQNFVTSYGFFLISINHANKFIDFQGEAIKHCPE